MITEEIIQIQLQVRNVHSENIVIAQNKRNVQHVLLEHIKTVVRDFSVHIFLLYIIIFSINIGYIAI